MLKLIDVGLQRNFQWLISGLSLELARGQCCHLKGANGAGKTTLLRTLAGLRRDSVGQMYWDDKPWPHAREQGGFDWLYLGHYAGVTPELTVIENLQHFANLQNNTSNPLERALEAVSLAHKRDTRTRDLSAGQQRRVGLARLWLSTVEQQPLWLLDEPLTALDVDAVEVIESKVRAHIEQGGCALVTSHQPLRCATQSISLDDFTVTPAAKLEQDGSDAEAWW